jgi:hypothetical protein
MNKIEKLMEKWYFRLAVILGIGIILLLCSLIFIPKNKDGVEHINTGMSILCVLFGYPAIIVMYFVTDVLDDMHFVLGKIIRKILMIASLAVCAFATLLFVFMYVQGVNAQKANVISPFYDALGFAPILTYTILYFFVVGHFEKTDNVEPDRKRQFISMVIGCVSPVIIGTIVLLILKLIKNPTITTIIIVGVMLVIVASFVKSISKYGFNLGGLKEYNRDYPNNTSIEEIYAGQEALDAESARQDEWCAKFKKEIEGYPYIGARAEVYASYSPDYGLTVNVGIFGDSYYDDLRAKEHTKAAKEIKDVYYKVARSCPYQSELNIEIKY